MLKEAGDTLSRSPEYETFARVTAFMMQAAGPAGREFMLKVDESRLDARSRSYLGQVRGEIQNSSLEAFRKSLAQVPGDAHLPDAEVKSRLSAMIAHFGKDEKTGPLAILDSGLDKEFLIAQLLEIRARTLQRVSDEALSDVEVTNVLINALRYRAH